jgi:signal peptidase I
MADDHLPQSSASVHSSETPAVSGSSAPTDPVTAAPPPSVNGPAPAPTPAPKPPAKTRQGTVPKDTTREIAETVVFVVVLVLLLKTFIAEAFVIPTGSMASTLWGYQKVVTCPECGHTFPVNCSSEVDPQSERPKMAVVGCTCPNCRLNIDFTNVDEGPLVFVGPEGFVMESSSNGEPQMRRPYGQDPGGRIFPMSKEDLDRSKPAFVGRELQLKPDGKATFNGQPYKVQITIDGQPNKAVEDLAPKMVVRVRYKIGDGQVLDVDAVTTGKPPQTLHPFNPAPNSGDRVLVAKFIYDSGLRDPKRHDVVVFKFPDRPQQNYTALNYIKRLIGTPGETIGIHAGKLYVASDLAFPSAEGIHPSDLRRLSGATLTDEAKTGEDSETYARRLSEYRERMRTALDEAQKQLALDIHRSDPNRKFKIIRKKPDVLLALSRLVYDNDALAKDLAERGLKPRWSAVQGWSSDDAQRPKVFTSVEGGDLAWLRYRHLIPNEERKAEHAQLITDFMGYNTGNQQRPAPNWVGDLMLEADVDVTSGNGEVWFEVSKSIDRFQARFNVQTGDCTLVRIQGAAGREPKETVLDTQPTKFQGPGKYHVRFANVDERLTLWVNDTLPFGDGKEYDPAPVGGPTKENDIDRPAGVGVKGAAVRVEHLKLWRDTYYTTGGQSADVGLSDSLSSDPDSPQGWKAPAENDSFKTMYVQPDHYLCLGDNSPESSDGRYWGLVPKRLMLGRALIVYYPFKFPYWPLNNPENRVGPIH